MRWTQTLLSKHRQNVVIDDEESKLVPFTSGVPHNSVLGLILFLICINDLLQDIISQVRLFADDTAIYLTIENKNDSETLQRDLGRLQAWESKNHMECRVIRMTTARTPIDTQYIMHCQVLEVHSSARYLGWISPVILARILT